jgi:undecaprenyl-diphosphatase
MMTLTKQFALLASIKVLPPKGLNTSVFLDINDFSRHSAWAHGFMRSYALWLGAVLLVVVFLVDYGIIWWRRDPRAAALMGLGGVSTFVALGLNQIVGHAVKELRPYDTLHHVLVLVPKANDYAFPSDHAVVAGALVASVLMVSRRAAPHVSRARPTATDELRSGSSVSGDGHFVPILLTLGLVNAFFGLLLCFARVYVGAHYPVDVVAGFLLGALVVVVISLARPIAYRMVDVIEPTRFGVLLRRPLKA